MHLDGCHFFVWVSRDPDGQVVLSYYEREGQDLRLHGRFGDEDGICEDCHALKTGARKPYSHSKTLDAFPDDAKGAFLAVLTAVAEIEEARTRSGPVGTRVPPSPVAPDGPAASTATEPRKLKATGDESLEVVNSGAEDWVDDAAASTATETGAAKCGHDGWVAGCPECEAQEAVAMEWIGGGGATETGA
jgi:hypothetical protein